MRCVHYLMLSYFRKGKKKHWTNSKNDMCHLWRWSHSWGLFISGNFGLDDWECFGRHAKKKILWTTFPFVIFFLNLPQTVKNRLFTTIWSEKVPGVLKKKKLVCLWRSWYYVSSGLEGHCVLETSLLKSDIQFKQVLFPIEQVNSNNKKASWSSQVFCFPSGQCH